MKGRTYGWGIQIGGAVVLALAAFVIWKGLGDWISDRLPTAENLAPDSTQVEEPPAFEMIRPEATAYDPGADSMSAGPAMPFQEISAVDTLAVGPAPPFSLPTLKGDTFRLAAASGKVVVLNLWATWCAPCREEIPTFVALQNEFGGQGLQFVGMTMDEGGFDEVRGFLDEVGGVNYPIVEGEGVAEQFGEVWGLPTTYIIDRQGRLRYRMIGQVDRERLLPVVRALL